MTEGATDLHRQVLLLLLEKIEEDAYPSVTMMNMVEQMLTGEERAAYAEILMDKIRADQYPSIDLLKRVTSLA